MSTSASAWAARFKAKAEAKAKAAVDSASAGAGCSSAPALASAVGSAGGYLSVALKTHVAKAEDKDAEKIAAITKMVELLESVKSTTADVVCPLLASLQNLVGGDPGLAQARLKATRAGLCVAGLRKADHVAEGVKAAARELTGYWKRLLDETLPDKMPPQLMAAAAPEKKNKQPTKQPQHKPAAVTAKAKAEDGSDSDGEFLSMAWAQW